MFSLRTLAPQKRVFGIFFVYAMAMGAMYPRLGDIQTGLGIGIDVLGAALIGAALGTQVTLIFLGNLIERIGYRRVVLSGIPLMSFFMACTSVVPNAVFLFGALFLAGMCIGAVEIVINVEADRTEHLVGRRLMNRAHAFWSFGFFAAGIVGGLAKQAGLGVATHLFGMLALVIICVTLVATHFDPAPARPGASGHSPGFVVPTWGIMLLVAFTLSAMFLEGGAIDWSVIYMRDVFSSPAIVQSLAFAAGALCQGAMRFFADPFVDRYGPFNVARFMLWMLGLGTLFVAFASMAFVAVAGFALIGIGSSGIFPLAMSAAAQRTDRRAGANVAALAQLSFVAFLIGPPLLGFIGEHFGIRTSFAICLPLVALSLVTVRTLIPVQAGDQGRPVQ